MKHSLGPRGLRPYALLGWVGGWRGGYGDGGKGGAFGGGVGVRGVLGGGWSPWWYWVCGGPCVYCILVDVSDGYIWASLFDVRYSFPLLLAGPAAT